MPPPLEAVCSTSSTVHSNGTVNVTGMLARVTSKLTVSVLVGTVVVGATVATAVGDGVESSSELALLRAIAMTVTPMMAMTAAAAVANSQRLERGVASVSMMI